MSALRIGLIGDHNPSVIAHRAIPLALAFAGEELGVSVVVTWFGTDTLEASAATVLDGLDGIWCVPASPYRSEAGALEGIRHARESGRPFLGTCGGFQHAMLEYARNVLGLQGAAHAETDPHAADQVITPLSCELVEHSGAVTLLAGSLLADLHQSTEVMETYHCRYGLSPAYEERLTRGPLRIVARDASGEVRAAELTGHPFFVVTLYQPERAALEGRPHPLVNAFVEAAMAGRKAGR